MSPARILFSDARASPLRTLAAVRSSQSAVAGGDARGSIRPLAGSKLQPSSGSSRPKLGSSASGGTQSMSRTSSLSVLRPNATSGRSAEPCPLVPARPAERPRLFSISRAPSSIVEAVEPRILPTVEGLLRAPRADDAMLRATERGPRVHAAVRRDMCERARVALAPSVFFEASCPTDRNWSAATPRQNPKLSKAEPRLRRRPLTKTQAKVASGW